MQESPPRIWQNHSHSKLGKNMRWQATCVPWPWGFEVKAEMSLSSKLNLARVATDQWWQRHHADLLWRVVTTVLLWQAVTGCDRLETLGDQCDHIRLFGKTVGRIELQTPTTKFYKAIKILIAYGWSMLIRSSDGTSTCRSSRISSRGLQACWKKRMCEFPAGDSMWFGYPPDPVLKCVE
jgi:hypothetical protein